MKNGQRRTLYRVAFRSLKTGRMQSGFVAAAIALTALLLTAVLTLAISLNKTMERTSMMTAGSDFHGSFKYLTPDEADRLSRHPSIIEFSKAIAVGSASNPALGTSSLEVDWADGKAPKHSFVDFLEGGLPKAEDGIAMPSWSLDLLGVPHRLGAEVKLYIGVADSRTLTRTFRLSGYFEGNPNLGMSGIAYVSKAFVDRELKDFDPARTRLNGTYTNTTRLDVMFNNSLRIESKLKRVMADTGIKAEYGVNWAYTSVSVGDNLNDLLPYAVLFLIIMLSGYLLIANIFYMTVSRDIRFYGLLKTIGTTPRQLRRIISAQAHLLFAAGLPAGLVLGYGTGVLLLPMLGSYTDMPGGTVRSASPAIFAGAALFAYVTVRIAAGRPGRIAAAIAPVEAVKYAGVSGGAGQGKRGKPGRTRASQRGGRLPQMALRGLLRSRRRLAMMAASLTLALILFGTLVSVIGSLDVNQYLNAFITGDAQVKEQTLAGGMAVQERSGTITDGVVAELAAAPGVARVDRVLFREMNLKIGERARRFLEPLAAAEDPARPALAQTLKHGFLPLQIYGLDPGWYDVLRRNDIVEGAFDAKRFATGRYALISQSLLGDSEGNYLHPGDTLSLGDKQGSYEVMAVLNTDALYAAGTRFFTLAGFSVYLPAETMAAHFPDRSILSATVQANPGEIAEAVRSMSAIAGSLPGTEFKTRADYRAEMQGYINLFRVLGYSLGGVVALVGLLNYITTALAGMHSRRKEFAVLESIGMTSAQLRRLLIYEGLFTTVLIALLAGLIGVPVVMLTASGIAGQMAFMSYRPILWPLAAGVALFALVSWAVTQTGTRSLSRSSAVERLLEAE
ncbi:ABC transporter permease [Paenibacillus glufosinatiresistens]|uniref:ABC transporter permease n=1 Tax=Paenibacillus glufosinatiresistens TaxID=3070657 RepID=UPI00286E2C47|nr:FtsX-like permease family protein [Paenibacillus sp. YX.27]